MNIKDTIVPNRIKIAETIFHMIKSNLLTLYHQLILLIMNIARFMNSTNDIAIEAVTIVSEFISLPLFC